MTRNDTLNGSGKAQWRRVGSVDANPAVHKELAYGNSAVRQTPTVHVRPVQIKLRSKSIFLHIKQSA
jgi:hypothetical protein